jgi:hypothetical protein
MSKRMKSRLMSAPSDVGAIEIAAAAAKPAMATLAVAKAPSAMPRN